MNQRKLLYVFLLSCEKQAIANLVQGTKEKVKNKKKIGLTVF